MQIAAPIGISTETQTLFQIYKNGILIGTLNGNDKDTARKQCANQYETVFDWQELKAIEVLRS